MAMNQFSGGNPIAPDTHIISKISEEEMQEVYNWVDEIPLSRPKKNIARDFSDCVLIAEVLKHYLPQLVELHNYSNAHSIQQKSYNWNTLNQKVLKKINLQLSVKDIKDAVEMVPETIERVLFTLRYKIDQYVQKKKQKRIESAQRRQMGQNQQQMKMGYDSRMNQQLPQQIMQQQQQNMMMPQQMQQPNMFKNDQMPMSEIQNHMDMQSNQNMIMQMNPSQPGGLSQNQQQQMQKNGHASLSRLSNTPHLGGAQGPVKDDKSTNSAYYQYQQEGLETVIQDKDNTIGQLRETVEILELKIKKLEQLVKLKDAKIGNLTNKLSSMGIM